MLRPGLYEQLIDHALRRELDAIPAERKSIASVDPAEAAEVLSRYVAAVTKKALSGMAEGKYGLSDQVALVDRLVGLLPEGSEHRVDGRAEQLMALLSERDPMLALGKRAGSIKDQLLCKLGLHLKIINLL